MNEEIDFLELLKFIRRKRSVTIALVILFMAICNIFIYNKALIPEFVSKNCIKIEAIALLISLFAALFIMIIILYYFDKTIKSIEQLKQYDLLELVTDENDIIKVKTKIRLKNQGKVIFLTSPRDSEVEQIIMKLAKEFSKDTKILVIDSDFRNGKSDLEGYSNLLKKYSKDFKSYIEKYAGVDFLNVGTELDDPEVLLYSKNNRKLLDELKKVYDYIIIYNYNVIDYSDALILSKIGEVNYIVTQLYKTHRDDLEESIASFKQVDSKIDGIIALSERMEEEEDEDEDIEE